VFKSIFAKQLKQDKMKLIDRLKPEYSDKLEMNNLTYPTLVANICSELETIEWVRDMKFGIWVDLKFFSGVDSPYDLFNEIK
jgi:hypothetical protein